MYEIRKNIKNVAKFERVSKKQFDEAFDGFSAADYDEIKLPHRATVGSAGYDFYSPITFTLEPHETIKFPTGIRCKIDDGYVLSIYPRSGLGFKYRLRLDNTVGIIDSDYYNSDNEGHIFAKITNEGDKPICINEGDAFCQGIFMPYCITYDDDADGIRNGGFGSTSR